MERARKAKDEKIRREVWERQNGMTQADATADTASEPVTEEPASQKADEEAKADPPS